MYILLHTPQPRSLAVVTLLLVSIDTRTHTHISNLYKRATESGKNARAAKFTLLGMDFVWATQHLPAYVHSIGRFCGQYCHGFVFLRVCACWSQRPKTSATEWAWIACKQQHIERPFLLVGPCLLLRLSKILLHLVALSYSLCYSWCWNELCDYIVWCLYIYACVYIIHLTFIYVFPLHCLPSSVRCTFFFSITDNNFLARVLFIYILCMYV